MMLLSRKCDLKLQDLSVSVQSLLAFLVPAVAFSTWQSSSKNGTTEVEQHDVSLLPKGQQ